MEFSLSGKNRDVIYYKDEAIKLNLSFKRIIRAFEVIEDNVLSSTDKTYLLFNLLISDPHEYNNKIDLVDASLIIKEVFNWLAKDEQPDEGEMRIFDWNEDAERIYASFLQYYNIDLISEELDWRKFLALFNNLGKDTPIMEAIRYRKMPLPKGKENAEQRKHIMEMKKYYMLDAEKIRLEQETKKELEDLLNQMIE